MDGFSGAITERSINGRKMERKLTPKQEQFCQSYIETGNASEAYRRAYDAKNMKSETIWRSANELFDNPKVTARLEELQTEHRARHNVTVNSLTDELDKAKDLAMERPEGASAAVSAILGKAKLHGLLIEKRQLETIDSKRKRAPAQLTDAELEKEMILAREARKARKARENVH